MTNKYMARNSISVIRQVQIKATESNSIMYILAAIDLKD